jgi:hypothetical protein
MGHCNINLESRSAYSQKKINYMKAYHVLLLVCFLFATNAQSQNVGIGITTPHASAALEISSANKGFLLPRVSLGSLNDAATIVNPAGSLLIYNTNGSVPGGTGYYYNSGTSAAPVWSKLLSSTAAGWALNGNAGTDPLVNFVGTTDNKRLHFRVANQPSGWIDNSTSTTFFGYLAGMSFPFGTNSGSTGFGSEVMINNIGARNTAMGSGAMRNNAQFGYYNSAFGFEALYNNATGARNVAIGQTSLWSNTTGTLNVAIGDSTMGFNNSGNYNTALGSYALKGNISGSNNIAIGYFAMENTTASGNTAIGVSSLRAAGTGGSNTAVGNGTLTTNTTGSRNVALGYNSMDENTIGERNTAAGYATLGSNISADNNTALGYIALTSVTSGSNNVAVGSWALAGTNGNNNVAIGYEALKSDDNSSGAIAIGSGALASQSYNNDNTYWASNNIAIGREALFTNNPITTSNFTPINGIRNIALGSYALHDNTYGYNNTGVGHEVLTNNTSGHWNNAFGTSALLLNTTGNSNVSIGNNSMRSNTSGNDNVAIGIAALTSNTVGTHNTAIGAAALNLNSSGLYNTAIGHSAGSVNNFNNYCTFLGAEADQLDGSNYTGSTAIGYNSRLTASSQVRVGSSTVSSIGGYEAWSNLSDSRFKTNIREDVRGIDFIMALRPVTYQLDIHKLAAYLKEDEGIDSSGRRITKKLDPAIRLQRDEKSQVLHTGFIAQEVEAAAQKLHYEFSGVDKPKNANDMYALRYSEFVVPLVKGMQEQQAEIELLKNENKNLKKRLDQIEAMLQAAKK